MASKNNTYNPWTDKKAIGKLLEYESTPEAYEQLMWRQRYGKGSVGYRGCPHCKANPQVMGLGQKVPTKFPYTCKRCGGSISATIDTPMYKSKVPLPTWFDCIYLFMGGHDKGKAPIDIASECTTDVLQRRYKLARPTAVTLKFGVRDMVFPSNKGLWGDELPGMYVSPMAEGQFERFAAALKLCCQPLPPQQSKVTPKMKKV